MQQGTASERISKLTSGERGLAYVAAHNGESLTLSMVAKAIGRSRKTLQQDESFMSVWRVRHGFRLQKTSQLSKLMKSYILNQAGGMKASSAEQLRCAVKAFEVFLERPPKLCDLNEATVMRFVAWRLKDQKRSPHTVKSDQAELLTLWRFAAKKKLVDDAPIGIPRVKVVRRNPVAWTLAEIETVLATCDTLEGRLWSESDQRCGHFVQEAYTGPLRSKWWPALILFLYDTGTRIGAALQVAPADIDLDHGLVTLRGDVAKTGLEQVLCLHPQTVAAIREIYDDQAKAVFYWGFVRRKIYVALGDILKKAGLPFDRSRKFHCFRRTTATLTTAAGRPDLAQWTLGHSTATMTTGYIDRRAIPQVTAASVLPRPSWGNSTAQTLPAKPSGHSAGAVEALKDLSPEQLSLLLRLAKTLTASIETPA